VRAYLAALGNPQGVERQAAAITAAELQVLAEEARAAALKEGASADLDRVVRMQGAADRALKRLGIKAAPAAPVEPTLNDYLARRAAVSTQARGAPGVASAEKTYQRGAQGRGKASGEAET
jgi:hypothetical protein